MAYEIVSQNLSCFESMSAIEAGILKATNSIAPPGVHTAVSALLSPSEEDEHSQVISDEDLVKP